MDYPAIERAKAFSEDRLKKMRSAILGIVPEEAMVLTCGSFARREASISSDLDFFCLFNAGETSANLEEPSWLQPVRDKLKAIVETPASVEGAFGEAIDRGSLLRNIGGNEDSNKNITRRMLFLLEGEWISNGEGLRGLRREILERYIPGEIFDHQLALFLLNDVIRYYRTMAVDYEYKTVEAANRKPWGLRNIKLVFSRKLLYASGLFSIALTADHARDRKIELLEELFELPVIDRMERICGVAQFASTRKCYEYFLLSLEDNATRDHLNSLTSEQRDDPLFRALKNQGHHFTRELFKLFEITFDSTHPIRRAVMF